MSTAESKVKGKWLLRLPFVKALFKRRITEIEQAEVKVPCPQKTVKQIRRATHGKSIKPRYITNFLDVFKEKQKKLRKKIKTEKNEAHRGRLRKELKALNKTIANVERAANEEQKAGERHQRKTTP
jgi:hypothetical protein